MFLRRMRYRIPPSLERRAAPRKQSLTERLDRDALLVAALGGCVCTLAWLAVGALTGLGKFPQLILPLTIGIALVGALIALTRLAPLVWIGSSVAIISFCVVAATPFVSRVLHPRSLVRSDPLPRERLDAVIVLSGGITPDSLLMPEPLDRLLTGLALMRDSIADTLVVTEPRRPDNGATTVRDQQWVRALVARPFAMAMVGSVRTTRDEATQIWRLLGALGARRVAVVTSPMHTRRACATFEAVGFAVTCIAAVSRAYTVDDPVTWQDRVRLFREWLYERAALREYRERGWLRDRGSR